MLVDFAFNKRNKRNKSILYLKPVSDSPRSAVYNLITAKILILGFIFPQLFEI
jgi:hypothetical protein